jgi:hypothetical protein
MYVCVCVRACVCVCACAHFKKSYLKTDTPAQVFRQKMKA